MLVKILCAGSGGQGVLTIGNVLANAAMLENLHVTFLPAYGAEMRGGTANCTICISDEEIASPVASAPDVVVAMNQPSVLKLINRIASGGQLIYNSSLVDTVPFRGDVDVYAVPANELAIELGNGRSANMVLVGSFVKLTNVLKIDTIDKSIESLMSSKKKLVELSKKVVAEGYNRFPFEIDD